MVLVAGRKAVGGALLTLGLGAVIGYVVHVAGRGGSTAHRQSVLAEQQTKPKPTVASPSPASAGSPSLPSAAPSPGGSGANGFAPVTGSGSNDSGATKAAPGRGGAGAAPVTLHSFNQSAFVFSADPGQNTASSSYTTTRSAPRNSVVLEVLGRVEGRQAALSARITNNSARRVSFRGGFTVAFTLSRDGSVVESVTASDPATPALAPGATAEVSTRVPLSAYGSYTVEGTTTYR